MIVPVKKVFITQAFGVNPGAYAKFGYKGHNGIDYRAFYANGRRTFVGGTSKVFAPHAGTIIENAYDKNGYGNYIKIQDSIQGSVLAHFHELPGFRVGDLVAEGDYIGLQGTTGNSTGVHLHWGYYRLPRDRSNGYGGMIDQTPYLLNKPEGNMANMYKELDLSNAESMKIAVNAWADLRDGKIVKKETADSQAKSQYDLGYSEGKARGYEEGKASVPATSPLAPVFDPSLWKENGATVTTVVDNKTITLNYERK